tara:strand:+ start:915 stop:1340 length:426 start_codon:yes stop_codon:yes gene_type:complete
MAVQECPKCGMRGPFPGLRECPKCEADLFAEPESDKGKVKRVNLESGHPIVDVALRRFDVAFQQARAKSSKYLALIHGYGSSGRGGAIKTAIVEHLQVLRNRNVVGSILPGETLTRRHWIFRKTDLDQSFCGNKGVTILVL